MTQCESELSEISGIIVKIESSLLKSLKSAQTLLDPDTVQNIRVKVEQIANNKCIVESIEYFIFALINNIQSLRHSININVQKQDYQNLEEAIQKAQAEIRKHIRLQQQLKIYMDGLQEKVKQLQKQLKIQSNKYSHLFQSAKAMNMEIKDLKKKLKNYETKVKPNHEKELKLLSHKTSKILSQPSIYDSQTNHPYRMYNEKARVTRAKNFIEKSHEQKYLNISHTDQSNKKRLDTDIEVSLAQSPMKKNDTDKVDIKQMTRTIQLKENYKKHSRKLLKYSTDQRVAIAYKRDARSNSVCH